MQHAEKQCILIFDEVSIRRNFTYNNSADVIDGVVDPLENLFSYFLVKGGRCKNASVHEFNITMAKLLSLKITQFNTLSNCEKDDAVMLPINFQTILEDLSKDASISGCQQTSAENALNIYEGNEEYFDENSDSFNSVTVPIELTSSRYFAGYIAQRISCQKCRLDIIKPTQILTYPSEMYIHICEKL